MDLLGPLKIAGELGVRGRVGIYVIQWSAIGKRVVVFVYRYPTVPPTPAQIRVRDAMRTAMAEYEMFNDDKREALYQEGERAGLSGTAQYAHMRIPELV